MIVKPRPWKAPDVGGYLTHKSYIIRWKDFASQYNLLKYTRLDKIYETLNFLSSIPWKINKDILDIIEEAWSLGGDLAEIPSKHNYVAPSEEIPNWEKPEKKLERKKLVKKLEQKNKDLHSLRCDFALKIAVAKEFLNETLYFPHSLDFRGRAYPIPPHLNHISSDLCRGLLIFAEGKPLGKNGLDWLKVQASNLFGNDKCSFEERIKFIEDQLDDVFDSADFPLSGKRWWLQAEDPWQLLATCKEITAAIRSGNPETFVSHIPVHQDGTCNGLQHYAALGGDVFGAQEVNLLPSDRPQDVYNGVAKLVNQRIYKDAENGHPLALILKDQVTRKIIKQTVMTSVYGVTFVGGRKQILNAMKDRGLLAHDEKLMYEASQYICKLTFESLREMFLGARSIMDWLSTCAKEIAKFGRPVQWKTPMGLPVVQPYKKIGSKIYVKTCVQVICLVKQENLPPNVAKHKSAFPPNYIHSLDSAHMMMTALACRDEGITYASVHDSFWTHACSVDKMNFILRDQFIKLHSQPLLEELREFFIEKYALDFPVVPKRGNLDLNLVAQSKYFFN